MNDDTQPDVLPPQGKPMNLGAYARPDRGLMAADVIAIAMSGLWLLCVILFTITIGRLVHHVWVHDQCVAEPIRVMQLDSAHHVEVKHKPCQLNDHDAG